MPRSLLGLAAGLALAASTAAAPAAPAPAARATITMTSYRYTPSPIYLAGGVPVRLVIVNTAGKAHDFSAREFFASARLLSGRVRGGKVDVPGGGSAVVDLVPARGTYRVHCTKFGHTMLGMTATIVVS